MSTWSNKNRGHVRVIMVIKHVLVQRSELDSSNLILNNHVNEIHMNHKLQILHMANSCHSYVFAQEAANNHIDTLKLHRTIRHVIRHLLITKYMNAQPNSAKQPAHKLKSPSHYTLPAGSAATLELDRVALLNFRFLF